MIYIYKSQQKRLNNYKANLETDHNRYDLIHLEITIASILLSSIFLQSMMSGSFQVGATEDVTGNGAIGRETPLSLPQDHHLQTIYLPYLQHLMNQWMERPSIRLLL